ncbi:MAG: YhcH/YjgK/YiaL family protein [Eubacteriales bacterium]|nr:YhcH/YjgK/YiaL family protein [Eubacteriales bacterium]
MILTDLAHMYRYAPLSAGIALGLRFLESAAADTLSPGRVTLDGDRVYVNVMEYETAQKNPVFEAHRRYIDIQCVLRGAERMEAAPAESLTPSQGYDEASDCALYTGHGCSFDASAGTVVIFFPEDAHAPCLPADAPSRVLKAVVKVALDA